jgi:hypothetical protein
MKTTENTTINMSSVNLFNSIIKEMMIVNHENNGIDCHSVGKELRIQDDVFYSWASVSFFKEGKDVFINDDALGIWKELHLLEIDDFDEVVLTTAWSGFRYVIAKVGDDKWLRSYEGAFNGINNQNLLLNMFVIDEDNSMVDSSYADGSVSYQAYLKLRESFAELKEEGYSFREAYDKINGTTLLYKEELDIQYLDEADALSMVK